MRTFLFVCLVIALLAVPGTAAARGDGVLVLNGLEWAYDLTDFKDAMTQAGASRVDDVKDWPASLDDYRVVVLLLPQAALSGAQVDLLNRFVAGQGFLLLVDDLYDTAQDTLNALLPQLGATSRFQTGAAYYCSDATAQPGHPLTQGVMSPTMAGPDFITAGSGAVSLITVMGNAIAVLENSVLLLGDTNMVQGYPCALAPDNKVFFQNVFKYARGLDRPFGQDMGGGLDQSSDPNGGGGSGSPSDGHSSTSQSSGCAMAGVSNRFPMTLMVTAILITLVWRRRASRRLCSRAVHQPARPAP